MRPHWAHKQAPAMASSTSAAHNQGARLRPDFLGFSLPIPRLNPPADSESTAIADTRSSSVSSVVRARFIFPDFPSSTSSVIDCSHCVVYLDFRLLFQLHHGYCCIATGVDALLAASTPPVA